MSEQLIDIDELNREVDIFEREVELRKKGKLDEKIFAEMRLRRGVYGQRYDNGQRYDGHKTRKLSYPSGDLHKGTDTVWDAPGMQRIKVPFGGLTPVQLEVIAELAEEYSDTIAHVTTRQDFQLHYVHIDDTAAVMRRLAQVGITTREACGNSVRNVTACPIAGVCRDEIFDVTPYAKAIAKFLLGHPDAQDFGRKFKIAFSGCKHHGCGLTSMHDFSAIAKTCVVAGKEKRGFELFVGGGLGAVPHQAKLFDEFVPEEEILPLVQAVARVFARYGEKKNRARARIKFLIKKLGIEEFRRLVLEERSQLPEDPRWTDFIKYVDSQQEIPLKAGASLNGQQSEDFDEWLKYNVYFQKQAGYATVTVKLPVGDITAAQLRQLADIARRFTGGTIRTTVEQNIVLRWISLADLPELYLELKQAHLAAPGAGTIADITACPGTDTCKLGIASSRGLAAELQKRFAEGFLANNGAKGDSRELDEVIRQLHIKISGCFNSCGQHHIADIGFYGVSRKVDAHTMPHFQVVLGGQWTENAGSYGLAIGAIPSKRVPEFVKSIARRFSEEKHESESFQAFIKRVGKMEIKKMLEKFASPPAYSQDRDFYSDWRDPREFSIGDMGVGECAGEVVSPVEFELSAAEREVFEAQLALEAGEAQKAGRTAYQAMLRAARGLVLTTLPGAPNKPDFIVKEFRTRFYDTQIFFDRYAGGKFARYIFAAHENAELSFDKEKAHERIEEAQLFIEAAYACYLRMHNQEIGEKFNGRSVC